VTGFFRSCLAQASGAGGASDADMKEDDDAEEEAAIYRELERRWGERGSADCGGCVWSTVGLR